MSVRIRMKKMGRTHRPFYRVCAVDKRSPRDGRVLEELGTYDTSVADTDARAVLKADRIDYWLSVGVGDTRVVGSQFLQYATIAGRPFVDGTNAIERPMSAAHLLHANSD